MNTSRGEKLSKQITQHCWCRCADTNSSRDSQCMSGPSHPPCDSPPPHPTPNDKHQTFKTKQKTNKKMNTSTDLEVKIK